MRPSVTPIHVFVVAPVMFCWGFERLVHSAHADIRLSGTASTLSEALVSVQAVRVDVMVLDTDDEYGPEALSRFTRAFPVLILTSAQPDARFKDWDHVGATAVVSKSGSPTALLEAIGKSCEISRSPRGRHYYDFSNFGRSGQPDAANPEQIKIASLTSRERQLIFVVICNATAPGKVIASRLGISEHTLRNHLTSIYDKLGVRNRLSLHAFATKHHLDSHPGFLDK